MSVKAMTWAWEQRGLSGPAKLLLVALADHANDDGECFPGNRFLSEKCGMSVATLKRHKRTLIDCGLVRIEEQTRANGSQTSNVTYLNLGVAQSEPGGQIDTGGRVQTDTPGGVQDEPPINRQVEPSERTSSSGRSAPSALRKKEFEEWLADYWETTGKTRVRGSKADRSAFNARREFGYTLEDLKLATAGCVKHVLSDKHWTPTTILRDQNVPKYISAAQKARGPAPKSPTLDVDEWREKYGPNSKRSAE